MKRLTLLAAALAASSFMGVASVQAAPAIVITEAPPAPRVETIPQPRDGRVWVDGHWRWNNRVQEYTWVPGHWQTARREMRWEQAQWVQRPDGSWQFVEGHWVRERGRGVARGNPNRDNDGDGVANRYDQFPWDPRRS